ncbi:hypothetical protein S40285_10609 [Stachybotrys chlorohalonatus IBT 40285]|uniref:Granulins domain-containing protein n=1 Tax=Stachybotrys chlorohalonatus (strain IBT 40285) TaxID=1283841 RepID=A0A084QUF2_STAC4|nr:hypothetical protein S40285_10609 [Stachybotrys chlorohalonata IBT 40285]
MKLFPVFALCSTAIGLVARDPVEGGIGLISNHTGPEFDRSDSVAGAMLEGRSNSDPDEIFGRGLCPIGFPNYCPNGDFCCSPGRTWCCVVGATKFCCPTGYPYCGNDLRCYS